MENLSKAKATLILEQPFFASLLLSMPMREDNSIKTLAVDGTEIFYNKEYLSSLTRGETVFVLGHEVMHCALQHMYRRGNHEAKRWNHAADYVINEMLVSERIGTPPAGALLNSSLVRDGGGTTEGVYKLLPEMSDDSPGPGDQGGSLDDCRDASSDPAEMTRKEAETKVKIIQAANAAKMCGKLPAGLERLVKDASKSRTNWKDVLRRFITEKTKTDYSFARPKRRFLADDIYLPSLTGEKLGAVVIAVDVSGSINESILGMFSKEISGIIQDVQPSMVHVLYFDTEISHHDTFTQDDTVKIEPHGGGGTAFSPIFKYIDDKDLDVVACIVLTDLESNDFGPLPAYPVLWATTGSEYAEFGEVVSIKE